MLSRRLERVSGGIGKAVLERAQGRVAIAAGVGDSRLYSLVGVIGVGAVYSAFHIIARLLASGNLGEDDPLDAILSQTLALGYLPEQPPLYDWALWLLGQITGPGALRFQLLKYGLLTATCGFIFLAARRVMKGDALWAFLSVEALALIYQISWRFHEGFTHAVGAMCAVAACFWALLRLIERQERKDCALFGVAIGLGVLTVTAFWIYLAALLAAAWLQPSIRAALLRPGIGLAIGIAAMIAAPHFIWLATTQEGIAAILPALKSGDPAEHARFALAGVRRAITEPIMYLSPLLFLYPLFFPATLTVLWRGTRLTPNAGGEPDLEQLILHMTLLSIAALMLGAVIFGIYRYPTHALMPLFLVTSIWLTAQARRAASHRRQFRRFVIMAVSVAIFAFFARLANMYVLEPVCTICRWDIPYEELADEMQSRGFSSGRIITTDAELGGNLHRFFADARIALAGRRAYAPARAATGGTAKTALVWPADDDAERTAAYFRAFQPGLTIGDLARSTTIRIPWRGHIWKPDGYRRSAWRLLILEPPQTR
jgi:hypothetical protein